ncbi:MAG: ribosome small subunit-dependent GTPase A [bacterium]
MPTNLDELGLSDWFKERLDPTKLKELKIARVIAVHKDSYVIKNESNDICAEITGKLMFSAESPLDYPTVGDWVYAQYLDNDSFAVIHEILPRKSILKRKTAGKKIEFQLIAANIDTAFIMQSLDFNYNLRRLERYLVMIHEGGIHPVLLLSKSDLVSSSDQAKIREEIHSVMPAIRILAFSTITNAGLDTLMELVLPGKTYCLLGSSGVGKTTLLNALLEEEIFKTQVVREKDGKGKHTTTTRQLISLPNNAMIIDTPGMRELGAIGGESGLYETFDEIAELSNQCRYKDCSHIQEMGCAVLAALENGTISEKRYQNYIKMHKESVYNEMSYLEKRQRDKQFGKFVKSVMKHHVKKTKE